ncbi:ankyrin repeat and LEM domain-containing protein 2 [Copidosoma floridanum]|uniref:ankyrin repeat and LEM domain-containing protein 2 n=1 Tax=Copidosoma floridanum TaxID=29053 RepID=UPI0006C9D002|nr:ankyrin repeat and LEM domain-containing protein 2 [Copidosoma floridanum]
MNTPMNNSTVYHAVYVPEEDDTSGDNVHIYHDKLEALKIIKQIKSSRLKSFKTLEEATEFSLNGLESVLPNPLANSVPIIQVTEEKSKFKALKPQDLTKFRKLVDSGDLAKVNETIWENPRHLIGSGDTPTILQEGCRYNALHIAVKSVNYAREMCELILNTVGNPEFVKLYYGDANIDKSYVDRASILQDLYLNTPDKGLNETPLHFATKYGHKDCVKALLSYPQCLKNPLNKHKQTPSDVICTRKCIGDTNLINEIRSLLEEQYYVPVIRAQDNSLMPEVGEPFSLNHPLKLNSDPISPTVEIKAFAGPMLKEQALEFRKKWKTPPRTLGTPNKMNMSGDCNGLRSPGLNISSNLSLRLQDTEKGLERVGRELASEFHVSWKEYWPFLEDFADLRCAEGLRKLEEFLKNKLEKSNTTTVNQKIFRSFWKETVPENKVEVDDICDIFQSMTLNNGTNTDNETEDIMFTTPPSSPLRVTNNNEKDESSDDEMDLADDSINEEIFLEGKTPSKIDFAVFTAIPSEIDLNEYPYTYRWRHEMQLASKNIKSDNILRTPKNILFKKKLFLEETL